MPDDNKPTLKSATVKIEDLPRHNADNFLDIYANNVGSSSNFYDLRFLFGQIIAGPKIDPHIEDRVSVTMSWEHARQFRALLDRLIKGYEANTGPIRKHPAVADDEDAEPARE
jgi:hypothetical protein